MAAELMTPTDELTGLPYILMPSWEPGGRMDPNHAFFPRRSEELKTIGGNALRHCRIQMADYKTHHNFYHGEFYGTPLPDNEDEQFRTVVMAAAGNIPAYALDYSSSSKSNVVAIDERLRWQLWRKKQIRVESPGIVRDFMIEYTLRRDRFSRIHESIIDEFLFTHNQVRRDLLSDTLLGMAVSHATDSFSSIYTESWKKAQLPPDRTARVGRFVAKSIIGDKYRRRLVIERLSSVLADAA